MLAQYTEQVGAPQPLHASGPMAIPAARLTRKESQLLTVLQQNAGRCLSRQFLLATIWGYQTGTRTRTLDVHIQRLRRKLGADGATRIMTVLRTGYAWQS
jgi:DNA-binding response OmpR family regulator